MSKNIIVPAVTVVAILAVGFTTIVLIRNRNSDRAMETEDYTTQIAKVSEAATLDTDDELTLSESTEVELDSDVDEVLYYLDKQLEGLDADSDFADFGVID